MKKKIRMLSSTGLVIAVLFYTSFFMSTSDAFAKSQVVAIDGMNFNVNSSLADNVKTLVGKKVTLTTVSGNTLTGFVKEIGPHLMHLEKLEGKEYYDALIRLENISVVEAMFRNFQR